ncbi:MAG TPA: response regulator [Nitrososphaeraceae archaeon]|nr:response regulator [Nitrososphaeraceae archaeon]
MKNFSSKEIRFSGDSIKSCIGFVDLVDSTKNTFVINNLEYMRKYYSKFINSTSEMIKNYNGKVIKNIGDCLLFYFPKTTNNSDSFREVIELGFKILDRRYSINQELSDQHLPPFNYRITMDYGVLDLALVGDYSQIDLFGSTINLCSKINSSTFSSPNDIIIGDNLYRILKSYYNILNDYNFINIGQYKITELNKYSVYNIKRKSSLDLGEKRKIGTENFINKQLGSFNNNFDNHKNKNKHKNKEVILVDDEEDVLFTYKIFLENYDYDVTAFKDPILALNYIRDLANLDDPLIILDIRMKNLNGLQLYQQIKAIDPTLKIIFITALDIVDEFSTIIPGLSKEHIMRKPVDKKIFINTVKKLIK